MFQLRVLPHSESIQNPGLFLHFVTLQPSKIDYIFYFPSIYTQYPIMTKEKHYLFFYISVKYHISIRIQTLYSVVFLKRLQPWVFLGMTLQAWYDPPNLLCRSSQTLSGWMGSVAAQLFSGLSRDVRSGSSPGSGWATQGHSETCLGCA